MRLRHLKVRNFRGIRTLDWSPDGSVICLVGPGDSCKSTILDAIELVLAPRGYITFSDADFYNGDVGQPICIEASVGELPTELLTDEKFGLFERGYLEGHAISDDPEDGWEAIITVRLLVTKDLEPAWEVVKDAIPDPRAISWKDRERLGIVRLGVDAFKHFAWGRGSALAKLTAEQQSLGDMLAGIGRVARTLVSNASLTEMQQAADNVQASAVQFGVPLGHLSPGLDTQAVTFGTGALSLHDGAVPLRAKGLGTRRLAALAIQNASVGATAISLIDEIEHGLEPFRLRQVLRALCEQRENGSGQGQVLVTTHSPTTIVARPVGDLRFVRSHDGAVVVSKVSPERLGALQSVVRKHSTVLLARKIIICEGKTEEALCHALDSTWAIGHRNMSMAYLGVVCASGGGRTVAPGVSIELRSLGYEVSFLGDSDEPIAPTAEVLTTAGVAVFQWVGNVCTEERLALDLPLDSLQEFMDVAYSIHGVERILPACTTKSKELLAGRDVVRGQQISDWIIGGATEGEARRVIGQAAKKLPKEGWFKDLNAGYELGLVVAKAFPRLIATPLGSELKRLENWIHA